MGWCDDPAPYLSIADAMAFPSEREGMPVCVMEALSMGVPVIGCNRRGVRDLVESDATGILTERNSLAVAAAMQQVVEFARLERLNAASTIKLRRKMSRDVFYQAIEGFLEIA